MLVELTGRQPIAVSEVVVHGAQPRRAGVADPTHLDRRGLAGEGAQPIQPGGAREIEQNVDSMAHDEIGQRFIRGESDRIPSLKVRAQPHRHFVLDALGVVRM